MQALKNDKQNLRSHNGVIMSFHLIITIWIVIFKLTFYIFRFLVVNFFNN